MIGSAGQFRQENVVKRKAMSIREWVEKCSLDDYRAPGVFELEGRSGTSGKLRRSKRGMLDDETPQVVRAEEPQERTLDLGVDATIHHHHHEPVPASLPKPKAPKQARTKETRELAAAEKAARDDEFLDTFDPDTAWLPLDTKASDYTSEMCRSLERKYWRSCGIGKAPWYGADTQGIFTVLTSSTNAHSLRVRIPIYRRNHVVECGTSGFDLISPSSTRERLAGCQYPVLVLGDVACNLCMACRRHGSVQH